MIPDCIYKYFCASLSTYRNSTELPCDHEGRQSFCKDQGKILLGRIKASGFFHGTVEGMYAIEPHDSVSWAPRNDEF